MTSTNNSNEKLEESKNEAVIRVIVDILTDEKFSEKTRLNVIRGFKQTLNKELPTLETKVINGFDVEFLLDAVSLADSHGNGGDDFQTEYFKFLLNGTSSVKLHEKIRLELIRVLKTRGINSSLIMDLWNTFERNYLIWPEVIQEVLPCSKLFIEEKTLNWMTKFTESNIDLEDLDFRYYADLSVHSCDVFCMFTACFNEFVILTEGNEKVLQLVCYFTLLVSNLCEERGKAIFKLYPRQFRHFIPFLSISPRILSQESVVISKEVDYESKILKLLLSAFRRDQTNILLLLTHYPKWLSEFAAYVEDNS